MRADKAASLHSQNSCSVCLTRENQTEMTEVPLADHPCQKGETAAGFPGQCGPTTGHLGPHILPRTVGKPGGQLCWPATHTVASPQSPLACLRSWSCAEKASKMSMSGTSGTATESLFVSSDTSSSDLQCLIKNVCCWHPHLPDEI